MSTKEEPAWERGLKEAETEDKGTTRKIVPEHRRGNQSAQPTPIVPDFDAIARYVDAPLKKIVGAAVARYVMWKFELRNNKWTKPPYQTHGKRKADTTDPATWCSLDEARFAYFLGDFDGIGIVLGKLTDAARLAGVDLDGKAARLQNDNLHEGEPYIDLSAGGRGLHALCIEGEPRPGKKRDGVEIYNGGSGGRYFTLTGQAPPGEKLRSVTAGNFDALRTLMGFPLTMDTDRDAAGYEFDDEPTGPLDEEDLTANERAMLANVRKVKHAAALFNTGTLRKDGVEETDASKRDYALAAAIRAAAPTQDHCVINRLMRASAAYREKWDTPRPDGKRKRSYLGLTIENMLEREQEFAPVLKKAASQAIDDVSLDDFVAFLPAHQYIFVPTREIWVSAGVDQRVPWPGEKLAPSRWLDQHQSVEAMTWAPGEPMLIQGELILKEGGRVKSPGCRTFNLYRPPTLQHGDPTAAKPWLDHVRWVFKESADHIIKWLAHRVQRPQEKINHALVLGGAQGIGKDTLLVPVKYAVGDWTKPTS